MSNSDIISRNFDNNNTCVVIGSCLVGLLVGKILKYNVVGGSTYGREVTVDDSTKTRFHDLSFGICIPLIAATILFPITAPLTMPTLASSMTAIYAITN